MFNLLRGIDSARVRELEQYVRNKKAGGDKVLGSEASPVTHFYLKDGVTGRVVKVDYDSANSALRFKTVR